MQVTYAFPLVPVANFVSAILALIPLPHLLQHWNTGAWNHSAWSSLMCLITGVNTAIWAHDADIKAVVWCDIAVRLVYAGSLAIVTTNFVMARRLYFIMNIETPMSSWEKKKAKLFDLFFCTGVPILSIALSWFIQGHRFNIVEGEGCIFAVYATPLLVAIYYGWLLAFAVVSAVYALFVFCALRRRQNELRDVTLMDPDISLDKLRRVIALGLVQCAITLPCTLYEFIRSVDRGLERWRGLGDEHFGFSKIWQFPSVILTTTDNQRIQWNNWISVFTAVVFFLFFAFSGAMWKDYRKHALSFAGHLGFSVPSKLSRTDRQPENIVPQMIFNVVSTVHTTDSQNYVPGSPVQEGVLETGVRSDRNVESRTSVHFQTDLEGGALQDNDRNSASGGCGKET